VTAAPLDPGAIQACLAPLGRARTLPGAAFTSTEVFAWEQEHLFEDSWVCLGRSSDLDPGTQKAVRSGSEGVLLTRADDGSLNAFYNVCRHRGHELLEAGHPVEAAVVKCPYHGWVYGLDGSLRGAPRFADNPGFDKGEWPLVPVRLAEWHGWMFVNASGAAPGLGEHCGGLGELVSDHECARLVSVERHDYTVLANWKIVTENYHECYHCPSIHPELCRVTPPESGTDDATDAAWAGGSMDLREHAQTMSFDGTGNGAPLPRLDAAKRRKVFYYNLFPNLLISLHPDYVMTHLIEPLGPDISRIECEWLWPPETVDREGFDPSYATEFWDVTNRQDWRACEAVQRGVSSRGYRPGILSTAEGTTHQFISLVARSYLAGRVAYPSDSVPAHQ
jgi:glycine betaine catabolism A